MILGSGWVRSAPGLGAIGTVTRVVKTTRVAIAATATGTGLVVGVVGVVPAVDDRRRPASNVAAAAASARGVRRIPTMADMAEEMHGREC
jgi:hypothetical protein